MASARDAREPRPVVDELREFSRSVATCPPGGRLAEMRDRVASHVLREDSRVSLGIRADRADRVEVVAAAYASSCKATALATLHDASRCVGRDTCCDDDEKDGGCGSCDERRGYSSSSTSSCQSASG